MSKNFMAYGDAETLFSEVGSELGKRILQMSTMPSASVDYLNMIIQYTGTTSETYTNGYFYKCIYDDDNSEYIWINVEVQDNNAYFGTGTLLANGWSNKQQTLTFAGYKASMNGVIGIPADATAAQKAAYTDALVDVVSQSSDSFTFKVENVPSIDLPVVIYAGGGSGSGGDGGASALADLTDVDIDSSLADGDVLVYNATSGKWENGEGGGSSYKKDTLFESTTDVSTYALSHPYTDYDAIVVTLKYSGSTPGTYYITGYFNTDQLVIDGSRYGIASDDWYVYFEVASSTSFTKNSSRYSFVCKIEGLKFGGSGGGTSGQMDILYEAESTTPPQSIILDKSMLDYDYIITHLKSSATRQATIGYVYTVDALAVGDIIGGELAAGNGWAWYTYTDDTTLTYLEAAHNYYIAEITGVKVGGGGEGTDVEANPQEAATDTLSTIKIGDTVYEIEGGESSGGVSSQIIDFGAGTGTTSRTFILPNTPKFVSVYWDTDGSWKYSGSFVWGTDRLYFTALNSSPTTGGSYVGVSTITYGSDGKSFTITGANVGGTANTATTTGKLYLDYGNSDSITFNNREIVTQTSVAIADGTTVTLNLQNKYNNPYVIATNVLPLTAWGGLVAVDETNGISYDSTNDTIAFKTYTNRAQDYYIDWLIIELDPVFGNSALEDYSTTEKRIGTWIDGKPLYQTTLSLISSSGSADQQVSLSDYGISNIDTICKMEGTVCSANGYAALNYSASSNDRFSAYTASNNTVLVLAHYGSWTHSIPVYVTLQYTKTTD